MQIDPARAGSRDAGLFGCDRIDMDCEQDGQECVESHFLGPRRPPSMKYFAELIIIVGSISRGTVARVKGLVDSQATYELFLCLVFTTEGSDYSSTFASKCKSRITRAYSPCPPRDLRYQLRW